MSFHDLKAPQRGFPPTPGDFDRPCGSLDEDAQENRTSLCVRRMST
jgi:hypothetical protein